MKRLKIFFDLAGGICFAILMSIFLNFFVAATIAGIISNPSILGYIALLVMIMVLIGFFTLLYRLAESITSSIKATRIYFTVYCLAAFYGVWFVFHFFRLI